MASMHDPEVAPWPKKAQKQMLIKAKAREEELQKRREEIKKREKEFAKAKYQKRKKEFEEAVQKVLGTKKKNKAEA